MDLTRYILKVLVYLLGYVLSFFIYPLIIDSILNRYPKLSIKSLKEENEKEEEKKEKTSIEDAELGVVIGKLERILILTSIYSEEYSLIPMLFTAKSIVRFPDFTRGGKHYTEYYLIGTLLSFILAIMTGIIIKESLNLIL